MHAGLHRSNLSLYTDNLSYTDPGTSRVDQWVGENKNQLALAGDPVVVLVSDTGRVLPGLDPPRLSQAEAWETVSSLILDSG